MRLRTAPLVAAAWIAVVLLAVRVAYRAIFGGGVAVGVDRGAHVLLELPSLRLPGPLHQVVLGGPVTAEGLWIALRSALPLAAIVLAVGILNALVDVPAVLARAARGRAGAGLARSLVIALASLPALRGQVARAALARRLRGARSPSSVLVPVLEQSVGEAVALACAMEVRGFAWHPADGEPRPVPGASAVKVRAEIAHDGAPARHVDLTCDGGSLTILTAPTGWGKTTLLRALTGVLTQVDGGRATGEVAVCGIPRTGQEALPPRALTPILALVDQDVRASFVAPTVREEIAFVLERLSSARLAELPGGTREGAVRAAAALLDVEHLLSRSPATLSAGEARRVALAAAVVHQPAVLLVDEPLADLDPLAAARVGSTLRALADSGTCVVVAEHRTEALRAVADTVLVLDDAAEVGSARRPALHGGRAADGAWTTSSPSRPDGGAQEPAVLRAHRLTAWYATEQAVRGIDLELAAGEVVALVGPNGSGKSTLLAALALGPGSRPRHGGTRARRRAPRTSGLAHATGTVTVAGVAVAGARPRERRRLVTLVPDRCDDLLASLSVAEECARTDRDDALPRGRTADVLARLAPDVAALPGAQPRDLSAGQRRLLALAVQLAPAPRVLALDEPTRALSPDAAARVVEAVRHAASGGTAVIVATHDGASWADRTLTLDAGRLEVGSPPGEAVVTA